MAKRRRGAGGNNPNNHNNNSQNNHQNQQGQRRRQSDSAAQQFWGDADGKRPAPGSIRPTPDPAGLVKSLGNPPLSPAATHQLAVVYEEAVRAATALAAANGLLDLGEEPA